MKSISVRKDKVRVQLEADEAMFLLGLPGWLDGVGTDPNDPAGPRLFQSAYPDDPVASAEYEVAHDLDEARRTDRSTFTRTVPEGGGTVLLDVDEAESWMRVVGDARLTLAARLGIDDNSWEHRGAVDTPDLQVLRYLTAVQAGLIDALAKLINRS